MTERTYKTSAHKRDINLRAVQKYRERNRELVRAKDRNYQRQRKHQVQFYRQQKRDALRGYTIMQGCVDCGTFDQLHLDHRDSEVKLFNPSNTSRAWALLWTEWAKCDVRCASCHALRHNVGRVRNERGQYVG